MAFSLPALPYDYAALEPHIDATTMNIHHTKHHQTYINNLNGAIDKFPELKSLGLADLNAAAGTAQLPAEVATVVRNNGGGAWNHGFFWKAMCGPTDSNGPSADLKAAIDAAFGSADAMKEKFNAAAAGRFGSGWAWLVREEGSGELKITSTANQDNPLMASLKATGAVEVVGTPILGLDVWEHAYYLKYQNRRPEYIAAWWSVVSWENASANFALAKEGKLPEV